MAADPSTPSVEETLAWEAEHRPRAGAAAIASGFLLFIGTYLEGHVLNSRPKVPLVGVLDHLLSIPPDPRSLLLPQFKHLDDHRTELVFSTAASAAGYIALALALAYLYGATVARGVSLPRTMAMLTIASPVVLGILSVVAQLTFSAEVHSFLNGGDLTTAAANDVGDETLLAVLGVAQLPVTLATALGVGFLATYAMRVGLLTRFMGILGAISGVTFVLLPGNPAASFWLIALGAIFLGRWPGAGVPPAWQTGRAEPWPTQQELREARDRARAGAGAEAASPAGDGDEPDADASSGAQHPRSKKRKRKRR